MYRLLMFTELISGIPVAGFSLTSPIWLRLSDLKSISGNSSKIVPTPLSLTNSLRFIPFPTKGKKEAPAGVDPNMLLGW